MKNNTIGYVVAGSLGLAAFAALYCSRPALSQVGGSLPAFIKLQATTLGAQQTGHLNITGTAIAGQHVGGGRG